MVKQFKKGHSATLINCTVQHSYLIDRREGTNSTLSKYIFDLVQNIVVERKMIIAMIMHKPKILTLLVKIIIIKFPISLSKYSLIIHWSFNLIGIYVFSEILGTFLLFLECFFFNRTIDMFSYY